MRRLANGRPALWYQRFTGVLRDSAVDKCADLVCSAARNVIARPTSEMFAGAAAIPSRDTLEAPDEYAAERVAEVQRHAANTARITAHVDSPFATIDAPKPAPWCRMTSEDASNHVVASRVAFHDPSQELLQEAASTVLRLQDESGIKEAIASYRLRTRSLKGPPPTDRSLVLVRRTTLFRVIRFLLSYGEIRHLSSEARLLCSCHIALLFFDERDREASLPSHSPALANAIALRNPLTTYFHNQQAHHNRRARPPDCPCRTH